MSTKTRNIVGWILTGLIGAVFLMSAFMKLSGNEESIKGAAAIGLSAPIFKLIGIGEVFSLLLFIFPRTGVLGTLLLAAVLGGAIATHLEHQQSPLMPLIIQCFVWITAVIRFPELSKRLIGGINSI
jgi:uncharacterized membrane protein YphA (DoxX/SURF4 family)